MAQRIFLLLLLFLFALLLAHFPLALAQLSSASSSEGGNEVAELTLLSSPRNWVGRFGQALYAADVPDNCERFVATLCLHSATEHNLTVSARRRAFPSISSPGTHWATVAHNSFGNVSAAAFQIERPLRGRWFFAVFNDLSIESTGAQTLPDGSSARVSVDVTAHVSPLAATLAPDSTRVVESTSEGAYGALVAVFVPPGTESAVLRATTSSHLIDFCMRADGVPHVEGSPEDDGTICATAGQHRTDANISIRLPRQGTWIARVYASGSNVSLSFTARVCEGRKLGDACNGTLADLSSGQAVRFATWTATSTSDGSWYFFPIDLTNTVILGDTLVIQVAPAIGRIVYVRADASPAPDVFDFSFNDTAAFLLSNPEHAVWYLGILLDFNASVSVTWSHEDCPNLCSNVGTCSLYYRNGLEYGKCSCGFLYGGEDCSVETLSLPFYRLQVSLLVVSNVAILPAAFLAHKRNYAVECLLFALTCFASSFYHLCDENLWCLGVYGALRFCDFFLAYSGVVAIVFVLAGFSAKVRVALVVTVECIIWALFMKSTSTAYLVVVGAVAVAVSISCWGVALFILSGLQSPRIRPRHVLTSISLFCSPKHGAFDPRFLVAGCVCASLSLLSWFLQTNATYWIFHSLWHVLIMIAPFLLLCSVRYPSATGFFGGTSATLAPLSKKSRKVVHPINSA